ncbi:nmrA-like family protein [Colletotrichum truncatum]|uniref:NmrA-like family protein n=1 Tax=Colletotrichum truncatum TaxID=5467 RepID=A0ACC3Z1E6_COLTU|nr:nmrA-like family protein [Colletotrichum truncatum]KAF6788935.1 nmrA-like family protein [Colletotrichum truncatum]
MHSNKPGPLSEMGLRLGLFGFNLGTREALIWDEGNVRFSMTSVKGLGDAVVGVLRNPEATADKYLLASSLTVSQNEILDALEKVTESKWTVKRTTTSEQLEKGRSLLAAGDPTGAFALISAGYWGNVPGIEHAYDGEGTSSSELLGVAPESIEETINKALGNS